MPLLIYESEYVKVNALVNKKNITITTTIRISADVCHIDLQTVATAIAGLVSVTKAGLGMPASSRRSVT